jgi:DNA polymerase-3 subunit epsilon
MARLLVIDTETGGIDPESHSILSLGGVIWDDGILTEQFEILIAERTLCVTPQALEINRIDLVEHCRHGASPAQAMTRLKEFLAVNFGQELRSQQKISLAGHNIHFDIGFLRRLCRLAEAPFEEMFSHRVLDTAGILRYLGLAGVIPLSSAGSTEAFAYFGIDIPPNERHTALGDAKATAMLLNKLVKVAHPKADLKSQCFAA